MQRPRDCCPIIIIIIIIIVVTIISIISIVVIIIMIMIMIMIMDHYYYGYYDYYYGYYGYGFYRVLTISAPSASPNPGLDAVKQKLRKGKPSLKGFRPYTAYGTRLTGKDHVQGFLDPKP